MSAVDYASYVIDITTAMLEHKHRLSEMQADQIDTIRRRTVQFVTEFLQHENAPLEDLFGYLNHDAMSPMTIVIGYSEMMMMGACGDMPKPFLEAVDEIRQCGYAIRDEILDFQRELLDVMDNLGIRYRSRAERAAESQHMPHAS